MLSGESERAWRDAVNKITENMATERTQGRQPETGVRNWLSFCAEFGLNSEISFGKEEKRRTEMSRE